MNVAVPQDLPDDRSKWPLIPAVASFFGPYLDATYLNHGYHFFAPDPGPAALIRYTGERADGTPFEGTFPTLDEQWPRLLYHRHFMLTEQRTWLPLVADEGYAKHLLKANNAKWVRLEAVTHFLARPDEIVAGLELSDPDKFEYREFITVTADGEVIRPPQEETDEAQGEQP
jgi:hypothetical protein